MPEIALAISLLALALAQLRASRLRSALAAERLDRLSASESWKAELQLLAGQVAAIDQRIGRSRRLTPAKRDRALELLAHGASEPAIARELEMRQAEVAVLARLRNTIFTPAPS